MATNVTKLKRKRISECPILTAASTPLPPRVECCVFGCRSSDRDPVSFHPLPQEPDRWSQWLKLINRQDLADKLSSGHCSAQICSTHFLPEQMPGGVLEPTALPSLLLPKRSHAFVYDSTSSLLFVQVKPEVEEEIIEIKFEAEQPPTYTFHERPNELEERLPDTIQCQSPEYQTPETHFQNPDPIQNESLEEPHQSLPQDFNRSPEIILPDPPLQIAIASIKPEPTYFDYQINTETQTNVAEAFYRIATFSAVEQINIPPARSLTNTSNKSASVQTGPELVEMFTKDLRQKYALEIEEANKKLQAIERPQLEKMHFLKGCDKYLDVKIANFIKSHAYLSDKYDGKNYPDHFKDFALKLYLFNPKSYNFVHKFFDLPSKRSIQRFRMPVRSGVNQRLMEAFKAKVDLMTALGKMCVVCFDVMRLKKNLYYDVCYDYLCGMQEIDGVVEQKPAEYAAVIAVRGLFGRWKQPVAYALVAEKTKKSELKVWLHKTISALFDIGLNVRVLVTNSNDEFLDVSIEEPYFEINDRKIYHIYDVPDLFRTARDELMQYDFDIGDSVAKWDHVVSVYEQDQEQELKLLSKITEEHVRPDATEKSDVKLAMQVFSSSVAAAMHFHVIARLENKHTKDTVKFISKMSSIFDILYSRKLTDAYRGTASQQRFLKDAVQYLGMVKLKDGHQNVESKFARGLTITIKSIMSLIAELKKSNANYLLTKNLSKDFMHTYFEEVRRLGNSQPTPIEFTRAFRRLSLSNLLNNTKTTATGDDMMTTLSKIAEYVKVDMERKEIGQSTSLSVGVTDYKINWPSNEYIAGYLLSKCLERHCCQKLVENLCDYYNFETRKAVLIEVFQFYNAENINRICKIRPPTQLRQFVNLLEEKYNENSRSNNIPNMGFGWSLYNIMGNDTFELPCPCFPVKFLIMLYIRLKIFNCVKTYKEIL